tara:strand:- start:226 stop:561 length:336 start_codon:yes stop_codon:yes gene_type:complete
MKKLNSFEDLGSLLSDEFKTKKQFESDNNLAKQNLEVHYSVKGRAGIPVIIVKGFKNISSEQLKNLSKSIKKKLGIGGSIKNNELFFQGDKRDKIISILDLKNYNVKKVGG